MQAEDRIPVTEMSNMGPVTVWRKPERERMKKNCWTCNHWIVIEGAPADPPDPAEPDWEYCERGIGRSPFIEGCDEWQPMLEEIPTVGK